MTPVGTNFATEGITVLTGVEGVLSQDIDSVLAVGTVLSCYFSHGTDEV